MNFYRALDGTIIDLDHVIAVGVPFIDTSWSATDYCMKIECAFGTSVYLYAPSKEEIQKMRNHLIEAWCPQGTLYLLKQYERTTNDA